MKIENNVSLKRYNTFGIDVRVDRLISLYEQADFEKVARVVADGEEADKLVLGGGSNMVFTGDYHGTVIMPKNDFVCVNEQRDGYYVEAGAGVVWKDFVDRCVAEGWHGLENMTYIPGTVGAAPVQNVGAYGVEAKDVVSRVNYFDLQTGRLESIENKDCCFDYRSSIFKTKLKDKCLVYSVVFKLDKVFMAKMDYKALQQFMEGKGIANPSAHQVADAVREIRKTKLPEVTQMGSAGSFFKNPIVDASTFSHLKSNYPTMPAHQVDDKNYKLSAGWMIDHLGWKGRRCGDAEVYSKQALVIVDRGNCTGLDVVRLSATIIEDVKLHFGVELEREAIII